MLGRGSSVAVFLHRVQVCLPKNKLSSDRAHSVGSDNKPEHAEVVAVRDQQNVGVERRSCNRAAGYKSQSAGYGGRSCPKDIPGPKCCPCPNDPSLSPILSQTNKIGEIQIQEYQVWKLIFEYQNIKNKSIFSRLCCLEACFCLSFFATCLEQTLTKN